jgi:hypothetical protein
VKTSELIAKAKKYLWDGLDDSELNFPVTEFICYAVKRAANRPSEYGLAQTFRDDIEVRMHPCNNLWSWLVHEARIPTKDLTHLTVQAHRLAWMNQLINEYKAKGD